MAPSHWPAEYYFQLLVTSQNAGRLDSDVHTNNEPTSSDQGCLRAGLTIDAGRYLIYLLYWATGGLMDISVQFGACGQVYPLLVLGSCVMLCHFYCTTSPTLFLYESSIDNALGLATPVEQPGVVTSSWFRPSNLFGSYATCLDLSQCLAQVLWAAPGGVGSAVQYLLRRLVPRRALCVV